MGLTQLCMKIFFARAIDVSLATFVTVLTVKGRRFIATIIGFIDVIIWFLAVREALQTQQESVWIVLSYSAGYAVGTFIGTTLSNILINGKISVQAVLDHKDIGRISEIRDAGFAVSEIDCKGKDNAKKVMLFIELDKRHLKKLKKIIDSIDKNVFLIINETKFVQNGFFK